MRSVLVFKAMLIAAGGEVAAGGFEIAVSVAGAGLVDMEAALFAPELRPPGFGGPAPQLQFGWVLPHHGSDEGGKSACREQGDSVGEVGMETARWRCGSGMS